MRVRIFLGKKFVGNIFQFRFSSCETKEIKKKSPARCLELFQNREGLVCYAFRADHSIISLARL